MFEDTLYWLCKTSTFKVGDRIIKRGDSFDVTDVNKRTLRKMRKLKLCGAEHELKKLNKEAAKDIGCTHKSLHFTKVLKTNGWHLKVVCKNCKDGLQTLIPSYDVSASYAKNVRKKLIEKMRKKRSS